MTRLDKRQQIALGVLDREWRPAGELLARTSVFDTGSGLARVLRPLVGQGLCERRRGPTGRVEWRATEAGTAVLGEERAR